MTTASTAAAAVAAATTATATPMTTTTTTMTHAYVYIGELFLVSTRRLQYFKKVYVNNDQSIILSPSLTLSLCVCVVVVFVLLLLLFRCTFLHSLGTFRTEEKKKWIVLNGSRLGFVITVFLYFLFRDSFIWLSFYSFVFVSRRSIFLALFLSTLCYCYCMCWVRLVLLLLLLDLLLLLSVVCWVFLFISFFIRSSEWIWKVLEMHTNCTYTFNIPCGYVVSHILLNLSKCTRFDERERARKRDDAKESE